MAIVLSGKHGKLDGVRLEIRVKNYRCFGGSHASGFVLKRGITGFIGENNSGKSTMLRLFYDLRSLFQVVSDRLEHYQPGEATTFPLPDLPADVDRDRFFHLHNRDPLVVELLTGGCELDLVCRRDGAFHWKCGTVQPEESTIIRDLRLLSRMFYIGPFRPFHTHGASGTSFDVVFGEPFYELCRGIEQGKSTQKKELLRDVGREVSALFGLKGFAFQSGRGGQPGFVVDGDWMPSSEMGSGVGQCFLIYLQAALRRPSFILIDEPEAHLHPSVQSDFVTHLAGYAECGLLTSTHHTGLAQSVSDHLYRISRVEGDQHSVIERYKPDKRLSQTLGELQVPLNGGPEGRRLLLVEGPTEIKALRQLLSKMNREHSVVLLPLGGSSMINGNREDELREVKKICPHVYAVVDSEKRSARDAESQPHLAFREACSRVGIVCHILERRALENYFSDRAVRKVMGLRGLKPFEDIKSVHAKWPKSENWKVVQAMDRSEWEGTDLWTFLESVVLKEQIRPSGQEVRNGG
ncbi:MAG: ATP-dependent endonuclease [Candidatus Methylacidiphilales bacterium]